MNKKVDKIRDLNTENEIKIFSDPYRLKIIKTIKEIGRSTTVKEIADKMNEVPAKVHYHLKKLEKIEVLELDYTKEINGIIAKYYRLTADAYRINYDNIGKDFENKVVSTAEMVVFNLLEEFKKDVQMATQLDDSEKNNGGIVSQDYLFLDETKYKNFESELKGLVAKYSSENVDEKDPKYSFFIGFLKIGEGQ